jgi:hypothetical protein
MKIQSSFYAFVMLINLCSSLHGQSSSCSDLLVIGVSPDTLNPNSFIVSIQFNATSDVFINYPHVSSVLDCNGDTVATGGLSFFGQLGQSTNDYPVSASGSLACEPLTAVFVYGDENLDNDTCLLTFGESTGVFNDSQIEGKNYIYPNPAINQVSIKTDPGRIGASYFVYDYTGKLMLTGKICSESTTVDMNNFSGGLYFLKIGENSGETIKVVKH